MNKTKIHIIIILLLGLLSTSIKFQISESGHNYDFESYLLVSQLVMNGENVYKNTTRYNYGPIWMGVLFIAGEISYPDVKLFRKIIIGFLSSVDIAISLLLLFFAGFIPAIIFILNPISIIISGYHNQFDNFAILLGLISVVFYLKYEEKNYSTKYLIYFAITSSLSLATKHIFILFPFFFIFRKKPVKHNLLLLLPIFLFLFSFVPFLSMETLQPILYQVFLYKHTWGSGLISTLVSFISSDRIPLFNLNYLLFLTPLFLTGYWLKDLDPFESGLVYLGSFFAFAPTIANQYLAIPLLLVSYYYKNILSYLYLIYGFLYLLGDSNGLNIPSFSFFNSKPLLQLPIFLLIIFICKKAYDKASKSKDI